MLQIRGLTKNFGGLIAVKDVDFTINQGEAVGLIGPNGAGKTTIFNLVTGFLRATEGSILFEGKNVVGEKPHALAKKGLVRTFQATSVFPGFTVLENLIAAFHLDARIHFWEAVFRLGRGKRMETDILDKAYKILKFVGLEQLKDIPAASLPHGHKRILGIAIALATEPKLLLLDEPLSGMNSSEVDTAMKLIHDIHQKGVTTLLIEHNMRAAMGFCQKIIVLNFGEKIAEGEPNEMIKNKDVLQAYLGTADYKI